MTSLSSLFWLSSLQRATHFTSGVQGVDFPCLEKQSCHWVPFRGQGYAPQGDCCQECLVQAHPGVNLCSEQHMDEGTEVKQGGQQLLQISQTVD